MNKHILNFMIFIYDLEYINDEYVSVLVCDLRLKSRMNIGFLKLNTQSWEFVLWCLVSQVQS